MARFGIFAASIGGVNLTQIHYSDMSPNIKRGEHVPGGLLDRSAVICAAADPVCMIRTHNLATLGSISPVTGLASETSSYIQLQKRVDGGTFVAANGGGHILHTMAKIFAFPSKISARQDDEMGAEVEYTIVPLSSDGFTNPLTRAAGNLSLTPSFTAAHYLGPMFIGDYAGSPTETDGMIGVEIDPGIQFQSRRTNGKVWASEGSIIRRMPVVRLTFLDHAALVASWPSLFGNAFVSTAGSINFYFQAGTHGGQRVARATTSHVRVTLPAGAIDTNNISVSEGEDGESILEIRPTGAIAVATGVAIPA